MRGRLVGLSAFAITWAALCTSGPVFASQGQAAPTPAPPSLIIQVGVDLIQIDASVTDKKGRPVSDLRPADFKLEVDGQKIAVTNAAFFVPSQTAGNGPTLSTAAGAAGGGSAATDHTVVFIVDDLNMSFGSMYAARKELRLFAQAWGANRARVALRSASDEDRSFPLYASPERFLQAVEGLNYNVRSSKGITSTPVAQQFLQVGGRDVASSGTSPLAHAAPANNPSADLENLRQRVFSLVSTINSVRSLPGRKAVVFVSEGFDVPNHLHEELGVSSPFNSIFDDTNTQAALRLITEVANRASVVLYTVDPRGLTVDSPSVADNLTPDEVTAVLRERVRARTGSLFTLQQLADDTGGLAIAERNDLKNGFGDVLRDQGSYYLVGFEPPEATFTTSSGRPRFHKIKLRVSRHGLRVRSRAGFYGVTDDDVLKLAPLTPTATSASH